MPIIRDHPQQPPGGHNFQDPSGVLLREKDVDALIVAIADYRAQNALPAGDPEAELEASYKVRFPWLISKVGETASNAPSMIEAWLNRTWREAPRELLERRQAEAKHAKCQTCPHYEPVIAPTPDKLYRLNLLARGQKLATDGCHLNGWVPGVAAWLPCEPRTACAWIHPAKPPFRAS